MKTILILLCSLAIALTLTAACSKTKATPTVMITIQPDMVDIDKDRNTLSYNPDSGVKKSAYTYYQFKYDAFLKACGAALPKSAFEAEIRILSTRTETKTPDDPYAQAPVGGFQFTWHEAELVRVK